MGISEQQPRFGVKKSHPGMQKGKFCENRSDSPRRTTCRGRGDCQFVGRAKAVGSYEELLEDPRLMRSDKPLPN